MTGGAVKVTCEFAANGPVQALCGPHHAHLERIEERLAVVIHAKGNCLTLSGAARPVENARLTLEHLYHRAERGEELLTADVDAAIRLTAPGNGGKTVSGEDLIVRTRKRTVSPRSPRQADYIRAMMDKDLVFGLGPAGTGKTYLAVAMAVAFRIQGKVDRIILSRPAVEAGEKLGFLPGDMREKVDPYLRPLFDALYDNLPGDKVLKDLESGDIEVAPLAFMRGRTLTNAFVILDEAQNTTTTQMKMFLTRLGENSRMVVTGDLSQIDLPRGTVSGLQDATDILEGLKGVSAVRFTHKDVVRHDLVTRIVHAYDERDRLRKKDDA